MDKYHISYPSLRRIINLYTKNKRFDDPPRRTRKKAWSPEQLDSLTSLIFTEPSSTAKQLNQFMRIKHGSHLKRITAKTVSQYRRALKFAPYKTRTKIPLTHKERDHIREFCAAHKDCDLKTWIFEDETTIMLRDLHPTYWRRKGGPPQFHFIRNLRAAVTIVGAIWNGKSEMQILDGYLNTTKYLAFLKEKIAPHTVRWRGMSFVHDRLAVHWSPPVRAWFEEKGIVLLPWPAKASPLNAIEYVWSWLKRKVKADNPKNHAELVQSIMKHIKAIPRKVILHCISHIKHVLDKGAAGDDIYSKK